MARRAAAALIALMISGCVQTADYPKEVLKRADRWAITCAQLRLSDQSSCDEMAAQKLRRGAFDEP